MGVSNEEISTTVTWDGNAMTQNDMMLKDTCITLDDDDNVVGSVSKKEAHIFSPSQPRGILHRAFSVFIFEESTGSLLLQQRASSKITFPNVWTNTCCSHPLHGMEPPEVDTPMDVKNGTVNGAKTAAIRKLEHELGIPSEQVPIDGFKFLTRLHYWAADTVTHGAKSPWGEHEIDYVLFFTVPTRDVLTLKPHPDEVDAIKWVTEAELMAMMGDTDLLFSPWFRLIVQKWVIGKGGWWSDLNETMTTDKFCDFDKVHRFDPPVEHMGGAGNAGPLLFEGHSSTNGINVDREYTAALHGDTSKKQGAYGKVKTHSESKLSQFSHIDEVWSAVSLLYIKPLVSNLDTTYIKKNFDPESLAFCDHILGTVSRSFAAVIRQLPPSLLVDVMIFYLVLRALDTIEDDMDAFKTDKEKIDHLLNFHKTALADPSWSMDRVGEGDERRLLQEFGKCHAVFASLCPQSRNIIADITHRMATGMSEFVVKDLGQGTLDLPQYDRYCHFVAGLVGEGLCRLFASSKLEHYSLEKELFLGDQMGLFLQKTNIIRDYLEDYVDGRAFWPQTVWKKFSKSGDLGYFADQTKAENKEASLKCLNELVANALELVPDCLIYLSKLKCQEIFRFCAIPQVMAIATLNKCYNNSDVFTGVVKIRKGLACKLLLNTNTLTEVHYTFDSFAKSIRKEAKRAKAGGVEDPSFERILQACDKISEATEVSTGSRHKRGILYQYVLPFGLILASSGYDRFNGKNGSIESHGSVGMGVTSTFVVSSFVFGWALRMLDIGGSSFPKLKKSSA